MAHRILLVDDEESLLRVTQVRLRNAGYRVETAPNGAAALAALERQPYDLAITDLMMPGMSGLELVPKIRASHPDTMVIVMTAFGTVETAVQAMKAGAFDYLTKPIDAEELLLSVRRALEHLDMRAEIHALRGSLDKKFGFENIIGKSQALAYVLDVASRAAQSESTILVRGETGTGKELLARAIHFASPRRDRPFVAINCGAIPRDLLESELFGHVKGAFTGAIAHKKGKVEMADGGTLFLDEIGEMPPELQVKMLRVIQEREIEKVGGTESMRVDVRFVTATHRNLEAMVEDGAFREDLFYRLAVIPLELPPLRERPEDIPDLVWHFFRKARQKAGRESLDLPQTLMPYFQSHRWPGNVRELENVIERIVVLSRGPSVAVEDLPPALRREKPVEPVEGLRLDLPEGGFSLEGVERELILRALKKFDWNQSQAARYLDISRKTLIYRMEKFGLEREA